MDPSTPALLYETPLGMQFFVTGFGRFGGVEQNPTEQLVQLLDEHLTGTKPYNHGELENRCRHALWAGGEVIAASLLP